MSAGFRTVEDLEDVTPAQLIRGRHLTVGEWLQTTFSLKLRDRRPTELGISMEEALSVIRQYNQGQ